MATPSLVRENYHVTANTLYTTLLWKSTGKSYKDKLKGQAFMLTNVLCNLLN